MPLTLLILVFAFGGLVAAGIPVLLAMSAVGAAGGLTALTSHLLPVTDVTQSVILLIGLAVGVDYSIFYLARERRERARGTTTIDAIEIAAATSGRAVLVSGLTVIVAMSGMFLSGNSLFAGLAVGTILVVLCAVIGSLTVLPALLAPKSAGFLARIPGAAVVGRGFRAVGRGIAAVWSVITWPLRALAGVVRRARGERTIWQRVLGPVLRHPVISVVASSAVLIVLALPALGLTLGLAPATYGMSKDLPVMQAKAQIDKAFPGSPSPAVVVLEASDVTAPEVGDAVRRFEQAAVASGQARAPFTTRVSDDHTVMSLVVPIAGDGHDEAAINAMQELRDHIVPTAFPAHSGITANITGEAAGVHDFTTLMHDRAPLVIGFVLLVSFLLLLATFRSLVVPIKAIVLNLLSVGAAYGILVAVFQNSWAEDLLGFESDGAIESWLPIFLFVVLFGLSMDYHVFIVSRIRELWDRGMPTRTAVERGHHGDGRRRHLRGPRHDRRVRRLRDAHRPRHEAARRRPGLGDPDRRDDRPGGAAAGRDVAARRRQLVPAAHARVAAAHQPRPARARAGGEPLIQHRSRRGAVRRHGRAALRRFRASRADLRPSRVDERR